MIWILIVAALISGVVGEWLDAGAILSIVLLNGVLGFIQVEKAERALSSLQDLTSSQAKVLRGSWLQTVPASDLVPGDIIELEAGDRVPVDVRLTHSAGLRTLEAPLSDTRCRNSEPLPIAG